MKTLFTTLFLVSLLISCTKDDNNCQSNKDAINTKYDKQIQYVKDHPEPTGINYRQITLLHQERDKNIANACN
jgi:hypothetical protein